MNEIQIKISELIEQEEKRRPYKDSELAEIFHVERGYITQLRRKCEIADSRVRLREYVTLEVRSIMSEFKTNKMKEINEKLSERGFEVSRYLLKEIMASLVETVQENSDDESIEGSSAFESIIGYDGSLKNVVKLAKAAIIYPPKGLNTIIYGESGVGKNLLVNNMYNYAIQTGLIKKNAELVVFNCADYADNPQLLLSILFGVKQGAYTGAKEDRDGLLSRAHKGILFLDEIHRMPPKGQEILFQMMDTGIYRRLGESDKDRKIETLLICATTEKPENCLLNTFLRRIPMVIAIPSLKERPIEERLELMSYYLKEQVARLKMDIIVSKDAAKSLLLYEAIGNIGKFFNDIQVSLAKGYLKSLTDNEKHLTIGLNDLPLDIQKGILKGYQQREKIEKLIGKRSITIEYQVNDVDYAQERIDQDKDYTVYEFIDHRYTELTTSELQGEEINNIISNEIEDKIALKLHTSTKVVEKGSIIKIIGIQMTNIIEHALNQVMEGPVDINDQFFFAIAFHINETIKRLRSNMQILNPRIDKVKVEYPEQFKNACVISDYIAGELNIDIPEEEAAYIAMYLQSNKDKQFKPQIGIVVITHGNIASNLVKLSNAFMEYSNIQALEMALDDPPEKILKKSMDMIVDMDQGRGVLLLVDMGSLETFGPVIEDITHIPVRTISRVEIVMVLEAIRIVQRSDISLDEVYSDLKLLQMTPQQESIVSNVDLQPAIVTTCFTGEGSAKYLKNLLDHTLDTINVDIIPVGILGHSDSKVIFKDIEKKYNVLCSIGTIDPKMQDIPHIQMKEAFEGNLYQRIVALYNQKTNQQQSLLNEDMVLAKKEWNHKDEVISRICESLVRMDAVSSKYELAIHERENMGPTCLMDATDQGVVVLHSMTGAHVMEDTLGVVTLNKPIMWDYIEIDVILVVAIRQASMELIEHINRRIIKSDRVMTDIRKAEDNKALIEVVNREFGGGIR